MSIVSIRRDWGVQPSIVRIIATSPDNLAAVAAPNYILGQELNIEAANNGRFMWLQTDQVLINVGSTVDNEGNYLGGTNHFFQISSDFNSLQSTGADTAVALTAHAGGGQANGTPLVTGFNTFTVVATAADSATLPANVLGQTVTVTNTSANSMNVYPAVGDSINNLAVNTPLAVAAGATTIFYGNTATTWVTK